MKPKKLKLLVSKGSLMACIRVALSLLVEAMRQRGRAERATPPNGSNPLVVHQAYWPQKIDAKRTKHYFRSLFFIYTKDCDLWMWHSFRNAGLHTAFAIANTQLHITAEIRKFTNFFNSKQRLKRRRATRGSAHGILKRCFGIRIPLCCSTNKRTNHWHWGLVADKILPL